ncbi:acyltransferase family protein [Stutzerimonas stutzeri]|uniref:acyltransferase family protein n=1 Tax=Stutzerimonas stutzeri TaxID=316 RepID=UPI003CFD36A4
MSRLFGLDALRGVAALCVAYSHLIAKMKRDGHFDGLTGDLFLVSKAVLDVGKTSVLVLFALSGYFVVAALYKSREKYERPIAAFVYQRFFRLFPLYWLSLFLGVLFPWDDPGKVFTPTVIAINATMLQGFVFVENVIGLYWTLQIEITFYVLCILIFALRLGGSAKRDLLFLLVQYLFTLSLAFMRYKLEIKLPVALPLMLSVCFLGALWKSTDNGRAPDTGRYAHFAVGLFYLFLLPICVLAYSRDTGFGETWYRYFVSYAVGVAVFLAATRITGEKLRWIAPLGGIGYIVFLSHPSVFAIAEWLGFGAGDLVIPGPLYIAAMLIVLTLFGFFVKRTLADPIQRYGDAVVSRRGRRVGERVVVPIRQDA